MSEKLEVFDIHGNYKGIEERNEYTERVQKEFDESGVITSQIKRVIALIITPEGKIILQKRSDEKNVNSGMYDKSVGGHAKISTNYVTKGSMDSQLTEINMAGELLEELSIPALILENNSFLNGLDFQLSRMACITRVERIMGYKSVRIKNDGSKFIQPYITDNFIGFYDGPVQFIDGEASGLEYVNIIKLIDRIEKYPELYTEDLKFLVKRYGKYLLSLNDFKELFQKDGSKFNLPYIDM